MSTAYIKYLLIAPIDNQIIIRINTTSEHYNMWSNGSIIIDTAFNYCSRNTIAMLCFLIILNRLLIQNHKHSECVKFSKENTSFIFFFSFRYRWLFNDPVTAKVSAREKEIYFTIYYENQLRILASKRDYIYPVMYLNYIT